MEAGRLFVKDIAGRLVTTLPLNGSQTYAVNLRNQPAGMYLVYCVTNHGTSTEKLVIGTR